MPEQIPQQQPNIEVPPGFTLHSENTTHILLPSDNGAFLNPVQEFNRDLSVACIRVWSEEWNRVKEARWRAAQEKKAKKPEKRLKDSKVAERSTEAKDKEFRMQKFVLLEALSATGLRAIRYAKEIPLVKYVIANDLSNAATEVMRKNVDINGFSEKPADPDVPGSKPTPAKVVVNEGDACALMYNHRADGSRVDVVDLDPYGTAAPFIDAAVQSVNDSGLLCVTCTDLSVLATTNYPEKSFANYGGVSLKAEYCHEAALRLVLHSLSTSAARYGRYIEPLLSLSIDFYVRLFVRVGSSPAEVKKVSSKISTYYVCSGCQSFYGQPLGRVIDKSHEGSGQPILQFKTHGGPPVSERCPECDSTLHLAGPMWSASIQNPEFIGKVLEHLEETPDKYGTVARMKGMLTVAKEELEDPFYFTPSKIAGTFHCECPPLGDVASGLLNSGFKVSRSHACPGSLKTTATRKEVHDLFRNWIKIHPVRTDKLSQGSPALVLLSKEAGAETDFTRHPDSVTASSRVKLVRYQQNPAPNWGPASKAVSGKRKRAAEDAGEP
ncbi:N2 N2-dimethylguanosine tRNA methyltransferase [Thelephora terrestris]|uniref:tRNA (guanine(26)-N(2))-dimethyltransferase n=1 Tax=Thelephora terrestris TaxID=56493 RepID=A0A9P6L1H4_9AGAM|nr:N2 N2-dimethylguanosine tRNA methyltransferase [Thelephora terrestris]